MRPPPDTGTIAFTKVALPYGWLGNMSPHSPGVLLGRHWKSAEALFQALRFTDERIQEKISIDNSPMGAKAVARRYMAYMTVIPTSPRDLFNMELVLRLKILNNPILVPQLLATGDNLIVEDVTNRTSSGRHRFWGAAWNGTDWEGENALGDMWMRLREQLKEPKFLIGGKQ